MEVSGTRVEPPVDHRVSLCRSSENSARQRWYLTLGMSTGMLWLALMLPVSAAEPVTGVTYPEHLDLTYYLDDEGKKQPIKTVADWEIRRSHILRNMQVVMGQLPDARQRPPLKIELIEETRQGTVTRKKIRYQTDADDKVSAYLFLPEIRHSRKVPAILCLHQTVAIGKSEPAGLGGNPNLHYAWHLAQRGYVTLAPDYPSFGEHTYDFDAHKEYVSGTMKAINDNFRAVDVLQSLKEVDGDRIGCIGHSLGGHNTMFTAAFDKRIKVLVSNCGFTRFHKYYQGKLAGWTSKRYMPLIARVYENSPDRVPFDFPEIVATFAPRPFLAIAPERDSNFEISGVRETLESAQSVYTLYKKPTHLQAFYPDVEHDFPSPSRKIAYDFFDKHLLAP